MRRNSVERDVDVYCTRKIAISFVSTETNHSSTPCVSAYNAIKFHQNDLFRSGINSMRKDWIFKCESEWWTCHFEWDANEWFGIVNWCVSYVRSGTSNEFIFHLNWNAVCGHQHRPGSFSTYDSRSVLSLTSLANALAKGETTKQSRNMTNEQMKEK